MNDDLGKEPANLIKLSDVYVRPGQKGEYFISKPWVDVNDIPTGDLIIDNEAAKVIREQQKIQLQEQRESEALAREGEARRTRLEISRQQAAETAGKLGFGRGEIAAELVFTSQGQQRVDGFLDKLDAALTPTGTELRFQPGLSSFSRDDYSIIAVKTDSDPQLIEDTINEVRQARAGLKGDWSSASVFDSEYQRTRRSGDTDKPYSDGFKQAWNAATEQNGPIPDLSGMKHKWIFGTNPNP